jgi:hypothetical protein
MKKVIILTAAVMAFSFATPQLANAMKIQNQMAVVQDKDDKYKEIKVTELPDAVTKSIANAYTGYKIDQAWKTEDNAYKVKVAMGDLKYQLFYDAKGELIKVEDPSAKDNGMLNNGTEPAKKSMDPANKSMDPANKSMEPTNKSKYPVK